ncbi:MAG: hypothetical protein HY040_09830 [Planctomycetes bacterium]|nr:hypothetical protein [Planctomycetota bacterium]
MRTLLVGLFLASLTSLGCVNLADSKVKDMQVQVKAELKTTPPITADQVNAQNAHVLIQGLWDEIDREEGAATPAPRATSKNRK